MNTPLKIVFIALFLGLGGVLTSSAQSADGGFKLKHRSSFDITSAHNPFWPIGWVKGDSSPSETAETAVPVSANSFVVTSISTGANPLAVINGKTYGEGETITALYGDQKIKILVLAIDDGDVVLQYLGKKYIVPMKRPELQMHGSGNDEDALLKKQDNVIILH